jgi:Sec-independent protein secretion pathway component TatC
MSSGIIRGRMHACKQAEALTFVPIVILMEISILISKRIEKARAKANT